MCQGLDIEFDMVVEVSHKETVCFEEKCSFTSDSGSLI